jgi:quercetin dioxygenase-like cupin family protein
MNRSVLLASAEPGLVHLPELCDCAEAAIVSRTVLNAGTLRVVLFTFAPGQELTEHTAPARALVQVIEGRAAFRVGETTHELQPGDLLHMPPGAPHAVRAHERFSMLLTLDRSAQTAGGSAPTSG